ncbi:hypothetical protein [Ruminococcus sp. HUN007]|uniref:hypothetical protein n=1 Tax=Ruminococcus sp. HUN007 TaxID=1514668 RepID=UPI000679985F|nr:hypothetical protein [Ruminococcus sp. HUN007]
MKKSIICAALISSMLTVTACGPAQNIDVTDEKYDAAEETTAAETTEETTEATTEETTAETTAETTEATTEATTEVSAVTETSETSVSGVTEVSGDEQKAEEAAADISPVEGFSSTYADLDNRCFAYKGKLFKLGEATFQDLIDAGVPFKKDDVANADNNLSKNRETSWYTADITQYTHLQFTFGNFTDDNIKEKDAVLDYVRWYSIYTPRASFDAERNADIEADIAESAKSVSFAFPLTLKKADLFANSGTPTKDGGNFSIEYKKESEKYIGNKGYTFQFDNESEQMSEVSISWLP